MIDISIVTYNSSIWIARFFRSLESQNYPLSFINITVCDNSSKDETILLLKKYQIILQDKVSSFQLFERPNLGFGAGHNFNISKMNSPFVLVTNIDLEFENSSIANIVNYAQKDNTEYISWEFRQKPFEHPKYYNPVTLETTWSSHACILLRRSAFEKVGGYEEKIFMYGEDVELSYRLRSQGYKLKYVPHCVCWHYSYQFANELKPLQVLGSTLSNSYIRIRYGTLLDILQIPKMYILLLKNHEPLPWFRAKILINIIKIIANFFYFFRSRPKNLSSCKFPIRAWDYEIVREGAFYEYKTPAMGSPHSPLVSVITRTYRGRLPYLKECLRSIENQTYSNIEAIVVEDGSETSRSYVEQLSSLSSKTNYRYFSVPKLGRSYAGNFGLSKAEGQFLLFLDDDDLFFADHIEVLVDELNRAPEYSAVYSTSWEVETDVQSLDPLIYSEKKHNLVNKQPFSKSILWHHNFIPIQTILFRRSLYDSKGGFDENLEYLEDWDLWIRYSVDSQFLLINKLTSLYRVPWNRKLQENREKIMLEAYKSVIMKQSLLKQELTLPQIISLACDVQSLDLMYYLSCLNNASDYKLIKPLSLDREPLTTKFKILNQIKQKYPLFWEALRSFLYTIRLIN